MSKPTSIIDLKVPPEKLRRILSPHPLSVFDPDAATPATPTARASCRSRQITAAAAASAAQGNTIFTSARFAAAFGFSPASSGSPPASPSPSPAAAPTLAIRAKQKQQPKTRAAPQRAAPSTTAPPCCGLSAPVPEPRANIDEEDEDEDGDSDIEMADKDASKQAGGPAPANGEGGLPFYEEQRKHLQELLERKNKLQASLANREEDIARKQSEYLDSTPAGNIITGFDNYTKGAPQAAAAQRRKGINPEQLKVFTRSSMTYNPLAAAAGILGGVGGGGGGDSSGTNTPGSSHAPTPVSSTFGGGGGGGSNQPTPGGGGGGSGGGGRSAGGGGRDRKKKHAAPDTGDSESDARETKKVRTNFGAGRK